MNEKKSIRRRVNEYECMRKVSKRERIVGPIVTLHFIPQEITELKITILF